MNLQFSWIKCLGKDTTPLELLNLYLTDAKSKGNSSKRLYEKINNELSWDAMFNKGYQSNLAPLLYCIIIKKGNLKPVKITVSAKAKQKLKGLYNQNLAKNLIQFNELGNILNEFEKEGIDVIRLKGAELAQNYYPDQALRPMGDTDLLVRRRDMNRAKEVLISQGYKFRGCEIFPDEKSYELKHFHFPYIKSNQMFLNVVELHQDIAGRSDFINNDIEEFWKNAIPVSGHKHLFKIPVEYLLLHLFWHTYLNLSNTLYVNIIWLVDIAFVIKKHEDAINWLSVIQKAREWGVQKQCYFCLHLTKNLLSFPSSKFQMKLIKPSIYSKSIFEHSLQEVKSDYSSLMNPNRIYIILLNLLRLNTIGERIKYIFGYESKLPLVRKEQIKRKYKLSSNISVYIYFVVHKILLTFRSLGFLYKTILVKK